VHDRPRGPARHEGGAIVVRRGGSTGVDNTSNPRVGPCSLEYYEDGRLFTLSGCRGTWKKTIEAGEPVATDYDFTGSFAAPTTAALPTQTYDAIQKPVWLSTNLFSLTPSNGGGAINPVCKSITFAGGGSIQSYGSGNAASGYSTHEIAGAKTTGSMEFEAVLESVADYYADILANRTYALSLVVGATTGNIWTITAPVIHFGKIKPAFNEARGVYQVEFVCAASTAGGNDELLFTGT